ncbi:hypothetical protein A5746_12835 [Mycolicibacterium conceptionense]|uniref:isopenicillin N synthase family dioxygenase n=1 Tax=Mycolicibacterium conceptionense TaxID=451644 RepID=UPI0007ED78B4|nr:2-oxoglutarate and iron-dependent oxygenase domain-containing protein [Mycolicibacterium conceptionense]OBJ95872.1 hypothetical protein A5639_03390 [Mycolicibacterium conceptionense]OMB71781.1 hypothetical protein A5741_06850 [Mycolicibacterium conceptionense]OMC00065.1 hypothetical protein A5746_12835 [Mycolicibacterium conceptionense]
MTVNIVGSNAVDVIDISPFFTGDRDQRQAVARRVDAACRTLGFLVVTNHGVSEQLIDQMRTVAEDFFRLPAEVKLQYRSVAGGPGYQPPQTTALGRTRGGDAPQDLKEGFRMLPPHRAPGAGEESRWFQRNVWPDEVPAYGATAVAYFQALSGLAGSLLRIKATALDLPEDFFDSKIDHHISRLSALHYPAITEEPEPEQFGAGAHTDYGSLTILHKESTTQGLQIQRPDGSWFDVSAPAGSFIVNIGDLLADWTNERWVSTVHRVVQHPGQTGNISLAFFHQPNHDALIEPISSCVDAEHPARHLPTTSGAHLLAKLSIQEGSSPRN